MDLSKNKCLCFTHQKSNRESGRREKKMTRKELEKIGLLKNDKMGQYEKERGKASYKTIVNQFIGDIVLCNNIADVDPSVWDNMENVEDDGESYLDIFQYFLCDVGQYDKEFCRKCGLIFSYSDLLELDVLCVDHLGTSWDYVLTNAKLFDNWEDLENYENGK